MKMKLYFLGLVVGFSRYSVINVMIMIRIILVMVDISEVFICSRLEIKMFCLMLVSVFLIFLV